MLGKQNNSNGFLQNKTGCAIPLSALRTNQSLGCGEFLDLIPLADFCKKSQLEIIQLLPVNDTGTGSSPYSALSAFALHPLYISIENLPEYINGKYKNELEILKNKHDSNVRFLYTELRKDKLLLLRKIYNDNITAILKDEAINNWQKKNNWIIAYSVFCTLKEDYNEASWREWSNFRELTLKQVQARFDTVSLRERHFFYVWVQMRLAEQAKKASEYCKKCNILLKGDIPILMNEDSVDVWAYPQYFNIHLRAGSPPDGDNPLGQNWGFPTYNWENLVKNKLDWWKNRLKETEKYFSAYRIDHILGFFRIWGVPEGENTAVNGFFNPTSFITQDELLKASFSEAQITWFSKSHITTKSIEDIFNNDYLAVHGHLQKIMDRIGNEELWLFKDSIKTQGDIDLYDDVPHVIREKLKTLWNDRLLIEVFKSKFVFHSQYEQSTAWKSLQESEKQILRNIYNKKNEENEILWENHARLLLTDICKSTAMQACAEDLGSNPQCVPAVLDDLEIFSLKVVRWTRNWASPTKEFIPFSKYPKLSVTTSSVHDSSTLRLWWQSEADAQDFYNTFLADKNTDTCTSNNNIFEQYSSVQAKNILSLIGQSKSYWCIHPLQDLLAVDTIHIVENATEERINIPGTVTDFNWTYRIPCTIEELTRNKDLIASLIQIAKIHNNY